MWSQPKEYAMRKVAFIIGIFCLFYVGLGLISGLLPVNLWSYILDLFIDRESNSYYKIVPTEGASYQIVFVTFVGVALIIFSKLKIKSENRS